MVAGAIVLLLLLPFAGPAAAAPPPASGEIDYRLGPEIVPNSAMDRVAPRWVQMRPDEGETLQVVPEGWLAGYQGGKRTLPIPGVDPDTGGRCMVFEWDAGRVDLYVPAFPLDGPGAYWMSVRTRSVVGPAEKAVRLVLRLLPPEGGAAPETTIERIAPAGPKTGVWSRPRWLVEIPPGYEKAELHLVKIAGDAEILVDDLSLRRLLSPPGSIRLEIPDDAGAWTSPVIFLGAARGATLSVDGEIDGDSALARWPISTRNGLSPEGDGADWEGWSPFEPFDASLTQGPVHLMARGHLSYLQIRVERAAPSASGAASRDKVRGLTLTVSGDEETVEKGTRSKKQAAPAVASEDGRSLRLSWISEGGPAPAIVTAGRHLLSMTLPAAGACIDGPLAPLRALAREALETAPAVDLSRAIALRGALRDWLPFTTSAQPRQGAGAPSPEALLRDCRRATPVQCQGWEGDLLTGACLCSGMLCRGVSSSAAGGGESIEGFEVWSRERGGWIYLPFDGGPPGPEFPSATDLAAQRGIPVAVAMDLTWGRRAWMVFDPAPPPEEEADSIGRPTAPADQIDFPIQNVHADVDVTSPDKIVVRVSHDVPSFRRYLRRFGPLLPWEPFKDTLTWPLAPGENILEIVAESQFGGRTPSVVLAASRAPEPPASGAAAADPYAGLQAYGGDPHVHTGLGLYPILSASHPAATGTPEEVFASAKRNGLDWAAVTDFSGNIDDPRTRAWRKEKGASLRNPDGSVTNSEWDHLRAVVRENDEPGAFAAFLGLEFDGGGYSSAGGTGRKLVLLPDDTKDYCSPFVQNQGDCPVVEDAYRYARERRGVVIAASPCEATGTDTDWSRWDPIVAMTEIYGGACESGKGGYLEAVVSRGLDVGAGGGSDSRHAVAGSVDRTICWAPALDRASILDAMRARRCYWSAAGHLDLRLTVNGAPMGSRARPGEATSWSAVAIGRDAPPFGRIEILRDGAPIASEACESAKRCAIQGGAGEPLPGVYYAVIDDPAGERLAVSSSVRVIADPSR